MWNTSTHRSYSLRYSQYEQAVDFARRLLPTGLATKPILCWAQLCLTGGFRARESVAPAYAVSVALVLPDRRREREDLLIQRAERSDSLSRPNGMAYLIVALKRRIEVETVRVLARCALHWNDTSVGVAWMGGDLDYPNRDVHLPTILYSWSKAVISSLGDTEEPPPDALEIEEAYRRPEIMLIPKLARFTDAE